MSGINGIRSEILQKVGPASWRKIQHLIKIMWYKEDIPVSWKMRIICLIDKRDNQNKRENYGRIKFLIFMYKVHQLWYGTDWHNTEKKNNQLLPKWIQNE